MFPILLQTSNFILYSYPLLMGLAWGVGYQIFLAHIEEEQRARAQILFWGSFISAWLGAKIFFIITSGNSLSPEFLQSSNFWMGGGFVFYGGFLAGALFYLLFYLKFRFSTQWIKWTVVAVCFAHAIGRVGCLLAGCCYGKVTQAWWGIHLHGHYRHPTQILEAIALVILGSILIRVKHIPLVLASYLAGYGLIRFMIEILRGDLLRGSWALGLTPSQWVSILLIFSGVSIRIADRMLSSKIK